MDIENQTIDWLILLELKQNPINRKYLINSEQLKIKLKLGYGQDHPDPQETEQNVGGFSNQD